LKTKSEIASRPVPYALERPDRIPVQRYFDPEFYKLECERFWPRVWQMACRLEEIPTVGDYVVYDILDQSIIVVRHDEKTIKAYHNACRHRGVQLATDRGNAASGFTCPFHGWKFGTDGRCKFIYTPSAFAKDQLKGQDLALRECRLETWGGCAFINLDDDAPPLRPSIEPFATAFDAWHAETLRVEWWHAAKLPVNWKLAMEAFMEGYHVMATHPQLLTPGVAPEHHEYLELGWTLSPASPNATVPTLPMPEKATAGQIADLNIYVMRTLSEGMAGMTHKKDVEVAEGLRDLPLPENTVEASIEFRQRLNDAVVEAHHRQGMDIPDLNAVDAQRYGTGVNFCFPHYFLLPTFGSASSYRVRPLGPEECLFEIWSLTRFPAGTEQPSIQKPTPMAPDDPRWPPIPLQDFANLPRQQKGLHTKGFDYMRLSNKLEGLISGNHQLIDGYLAGQTSEKLVAAAQRVSGHIDREIENLGL
jgi:phenylpropionate dioxygenase-like ring-hydroxylating dioxygenase large terminal subunit